MKMNGWACAHLLRQKLVEDQAEEIPIRGLGEHASLLELRN